MVVCGLVLLVWASRQGVGTAGKGSSDHSDPQICHRKHPPSRQPRDRPVLLTATQGRLELLDSQLGLGLAWA